MREQKQTRLVPGKARRPAPVRTGSDARPPLSELAQKTAAPQERVTCPHHNRLYAGSSLCHNTPQPERSRKVFWFPQILILRLPLEQGPRWCPHLKGQLPDLTFCMQGHFWCSPCPQFFTFSLLTTTCLLQGQSTEDPKPTWLPDEVGVDCYSPLLLPQKARRQRPLAVGGPVGHLCVWAPVWGNPYLRTA